MKFYLRVINPVISLIVFILCFWAATASEDEFHLEGIVIGGMSTYFFAKGLFTSCSLLILGRILLEIISHSEKSPGMKYKKYEKLYSVLFGILTLGLLAGLFVSNGSERWGKDAVEFETIKDPPSLQVVDIHRVRSSDHVKYSCRINNESKTDWSKIEIESSLFINGNLSDRRDVELDSLKSGHTESLIFNFTDFRNNTLSDSVDIRFEINARKPKI